jgi:hypothetical protein
MSPLRQQMIGAMVLRGCGCTACELLPLQP